MFAEGRVHALGIASCKLRLGQKVPHPPQIDVLVHLPRHSVPKVRASRFAAVDVPQKVKAGNRGSQSRRQQRNQPKGPKTRRVILQDYPKHPASSSEVSLADERTFSRQSCVHLCTVVGEKIGSSGVKTRASCIIRIEAPIHIRGHYLHQLFCFLARGGGSFGRAPLPLIETSPSPSGHGLVGGWRRRRGRQRIFSFSFQLDTLTIPDHATGEAEHVEIQVDTWWGWGWGWGDTLIS